MHLSKPIGLKLKQLPSLPQKLGRLANVLGKHIESNPGVLKFLDLGFPRNASQLREQYDVWLKEEREKKRKMWVVESGGNTIGHAGFHTIKLLHVDSGLAKPVKEKVWLFSISLYLLNPHAQGKGTGTKIAEELKARAEKIAGKNKFLLRAGTFNPAAEAVFKKLGFEKKGVHDWEGVRVGSWYFFGPGVKREWFDFTQIVAKPKTKK